MQDQQDNTPIKEPGPKPGQRPRERKRRPAWQRLLRGIGIAAICVAAFFIVVCSAIVWFLSPERLTPIIEKVASEQMKATVTLDRAELTFWSTFPHLKINVDELRVVSHSLDSIDPDLRATLPADVDSLLSIGSFQGSVNVLKLISGDISLKDVSIDRPRINLVQVNDSLSNFDIFPPSEEPKDTLPSTIPNISVNHFCITNARPISYRSLADSVEVAVTINTVDLKGTPAPQYDLIIQSRFNSPLLRDINYERISLKLDGHIDWNGRNPNLLGIRDLNIIAEEFDITIDTQIDFTRELVFRTLSAKLNSLDINALKQHATAELAEIVDPLQTDMKVSMGLRILEPLVIAEQVKMPSAVVTLDIPDCYVYYRSARYNKFGLSLIANIDGYDLDASVVDLQRLVVEGRAIDLDLSGTATALLSDPRIRGILKGDIDFSKMPRDIDIFKEIATLSGRLNANADFDMRLSDLSRDNFHRLRVNGDFILDDFAFAARDGFTKAYTRHATINFGSGVSIHRDSLPSVDSLLVVKLRMDTASFATEGVKASVRDLAASLGTTNRAPSADTTAITPFGGVISMASVRYESEADSLHLRLRKARGFATLRRWEGNARMPQLRLKLDVGRLAMIDPTFGAGMRDAVFDVTAHLRPKREVNDSTREARRQARFRHGAAGHHRVITAEMLDSMGIETVDFNIDNSLKSLMRRWELEGSATAAKGFLRMPALPLRQRFSNLDLHFTLDSVNLYNIDYKLGQSDFNVKGSIRNIRRALASRRPSPIIIDFEIASDTINVNQIVQALASESKGVHYNENELDRLATMDMDKLADPQAPADSVMGPILVPVNIDAGLTVKAKNVLYSNVRLSDFMGELLVYGGSINLHDLHADTEVGHIEMSGLYTAPNVHKMSFGMGMGLRDFHIQRLPMMIPAIDSIVPMIKDFAGIVNAEVAVTTDLTPDMYFDIPSLKAVFKFEGDSLVLIDNATFRKLSRWLMFKNKNRNMIDHLSIEMEVDSGQLVLYPFQLDIDRYKLGVMGSNDLDFNLNYHISVLKSPIPFKFGINIKGTPEHMKIRFGGAKFKPNMIARRDSIANNTRINLVHEINSAFRRGIRAAQLGPLKFDAIPAPNIDQMPETGFTAADSLLMIQEGLIDAPPAPLPAADPESKPSKNKKGKK